MGTDNVDVGVGDVHINVGDVEVGVGVGIDEDVGVATDEVDNVDAV